MPRTLSLDDVLNYEALPPEVRDLAERYIASKRASPPPVAKSEDWDIGYDEGYTEGYHDGIEGGRYQVATDQPPRGDTESGGVVTAIPVE